MRELKFRVWDKKDKRMITQEQNFSRLKVTNIGVFKLDPCIKENRWILLDKDRFEIMQYTGYKDKNDIDVYEGDIINVNHGLRELSELVHGNYEAYFDNECRGFRFKKAEKGLEHAGLLDTDIFEVVGNIYEC